MATQILIGTGLILLNTLLAVLFFWALTATLLRLRNWAVKPPHGLRLGLLTLGSVLWLQAMLSLCTWFWALCFFFIGLFETMEEAVYFAIICFTTLGFGDVILGEEWRLLSGMAAANGLLHFGTVTAMLVEAFRRIRLEQTQGVLD